MKPLIFLIAVSLSAADIKVDLKSEQVDKPPVIFEPMVGTWLVGQDSGFVTGAEFIVDGGMTRKMIYAPD